MSKAFYEDMGQRIYELRKQLRLTQEELATKAGLSHQVCSTAERATKALRSENVVKIANALEVSTDYLLTGKSSSTDYARLADILSKLSQSDFRYLSETIRLFIEYSERN